MKKSAKVIVVLLIIGLAVWGCVTLITGKSTELVSYDTLEDKESTVMYLFKDEIVVDSGGGVLQPIASDGERIPKGARIGAILSENTDEFALHAYLRVQDRIDSVSTISADATYSETLRADELISDYAEEIASYAENFDMQALSRMKDKLLTAKDERTAKSGKKEELLAELTAESDSFSESLGTSVREIYSPEAGILFLQTDGMESFMQTQNTEGLMPSSLAELVKEKKNEVNGCKIMHESVWRGAMLISEEKAAGIDKGQMVTLRYHDCGGETARAEVIYVSEPEDGKCVLVISTNRAAEGLLERRRTSADVIFNRYEGLRVPSKALCEVGGQTGVYVETVTERIFKPVEVAYKGEKYAIVKETEEKKLRLYDKIVF